MTYYIHIMASPTITQMLTHVLSFNRDIVITDIPNSHIILCDTTAHIDTYNNTHMMVVLGQHILLPTTPQHIFQYIQTRYNQYEKNRPISKHGLILSPEHSTLSYENNTVRCTALEINILRILMITDNISKTDLLHTVWGVNDGVNTHTVATHMSRLRKKISGICDCIHICLTSESVYKLIKYQK